MVAPIPTLAPGSGWECPLRRAHANGFWQNYAFLSQWMSRIGGGTDQVQRNIIGDNVLGLPPEPRVDKGIAFRDIPT